MSSDITGLNDSIEYFTLEYHPQWLYHSHMTGTHFAQLFTNKMHSNNGFCFSECCMHAFDENILESVHGGVSGPF